MKKFILTTLSILLVLAALFTYVLYTEGVFETLQDTPTSELEPFGMKCEAGKCAAGKCAGGKPSTEKEMSK